MRIEGPETTIRIVLIEDHDMVATAFGAMIAYEPDLDLVGTATTMADGVDEVRRRCPDVVITDLRLPDGHATDHIDALRSSPTPPKIVIVTGAPSEKALLDALDAGVRGFISKAQPMDELWDAVRRVASGATVVAPELMPALVGQASRKASTNLSQREAEVLQLLADGEGTAAIADALHLSPNTVRNHVAQVLAKLDAHSRLEAVSEATRRGIISPATPF